MEDKDIEIIGILYKMMVKKLERGMKQTKKEVYSLA